MIRNLFVIAGASFVLAAVCFASAAAFGGHDLWNHPWMMEPGRNWSFTWGHDRSDDRWGDHWSSASNATSSDGAGGSREIAWSGADALDVDLPADVQFTQVAGPGKLVITGPKDTLDHVVLSGSHLQFDDDEMNMGRISVVMTAPAVRHFAISGDGSLAIQNFDQDELDVDVSGSGDVNAKGKARAVKLDISGSGDVDLGGVQADSADAEISGSGKASIAPASAADLHISGDGEIDLLTHPANMNSDVSGSGRIIEGASAAKPS